jgi:hypothetical protein
MAYITEENTDNIKLVLTNYGKEQAFKTGLLNVIKYFTISDDGLIYTMDVKPTEFIDMNGLHKTSSNISSGNKNNIQKLK